MVNTVNSSIMNLFGALNRGEATLVNPVASHAATHISRSQSMSDQVRLQMAAMDPSDENYPTLRSLQTTLDDSTIQIGQLRDHTNTMLYGDSNGSVISGGLTSNLGQAMSAMNLNNQMAAAGQTPLGSHSDSDPCAIFMDFFGSLLGDGLDLLNQIGQALSDLLQPITQLINQINTAISAGIAALREAIQAGIAALREAISAIATMIRDELDAFAQWLSAQLNFNLSSFLSSVFGNTCARLLISAVANPVTLQMLSMNTSGTLAPQPPNVGGLW